MKIVPILFLSALIIAGAGTAHAESMRGTIKTVDTEANKFTLKNGIAFSYGDEIDEAQLRKDARVRVKFRHKSGKLVVRHLTVRDAPQS